ncbi:MAG: SMI1/KNR4 family protein [Oscillospiraceae bacterium]
MNLQELEEKLEVRFPEKFHRIYSTGAMEWFSISHESFNADKNRYLNDPKAFLMLNCDCEPLFFDDIPGRMDELEEWISWRADDGLTLKDGIRLIPFAMTGGGDLYCFLYGNGPAEPEVILFYHDDDPVYIGKDFDALLYYAMLSAAAFDEDTEGEFWKAQLDHLDDKYKKMLEGKTADELVGEYEANIPKKADIWS